MKHHRLLLYLSDKIDLKVEKQKSDTKIIHLTY